MKSYDISLCGVNRTLPLIPIPGDLAFASFVIISDTELVSAAAAGEADAPLDLRRGRQPQQRRGGADLQQVAEHVARPGDLGRAGRDGRVGQALARQRPVAAVGAEVVAPRRHSRLLPARA